jgi:hypothetical protein
MRAVMSWTRLYTAGLPDGLRNDRLDEVLSDLHEQTMADTSVGVSDLALSRSIRHRAWRGALADLTWRRTLVRSLPGRAPTRVRRGILAAAIVAGSIASVLMFMNAGTNASSASSAQVQVGYLQDQVRSESLFVLNLNDQFLSDFRTSYTDPIYAGYLKQQSTGAIEELQNFRLLRQQLMNEAAHSERMAEDAERMTAVARGLTGLSSVLLLGLMVLLTIEPRLPKRRKRLAPEGTSQSR